MKKYITAGMVCFTLLSFFPVVSSGGDFKVTRVFDGDTIMAEGHDIVIYVLLAGIDAPEIGSLKQQPQPYAQKAQRYLEERIFSKVVDIKGYATGSFPYNYLVGEIYVNGKNVNIGMIEQGFAEVWHEKPPPGLSIAPYLDAERQAKKSRKGIWSLGDQYMSPHEWRKRYAKK